MEPVLGHAEATAPPSPMGRITAVFAAVGTAWILFIMGLICADVIGRAAFNAPILGVPEMVQFSIVGIVFLQLPQTLRTGGLTRSDVLLGQIQRRTPRVGHLMQLVYDLIGLALFVVIVTTTWPLAVAAFENDEFYGSTGVVQIPTGPLKVIIMAGCTLMAIQFLINAVGHIRGLTSPARPVS